MAARSKEEVGRFKQGQTNLEKLAQASDAVQKVRFGTGPPSSASSTFGTACLCDAAPPPPPPPPPLARSACYHHPLHARGAPLPQGSSGRPGRTPSPSRLKSTAPAGLACAACGANGVGRGVPDMVWVRFEPVDQGLRHQRPSTPGAADGLRRARRSPARQRRRCGRSGL